MESDVSFPRNPFITITRSQVLGLLFQLQNLAYNYVLHHTVGQGPPEQTGNNQSKPSGPKSPPPPFAEQRDLWVAGGETQPSGMFPFATTALQS